MGEFSDVMKPYRMKVYDIQAIEIDTQWLQWLTKEHGYTSVNLGDYYVIGIDGAKQVIPKVQFERLFEPVDE